MMIHIRKAVHTDFKAVHRLLMDFAHFLGRPGSVKVTPEQMERDKDLIQCYVALDGEEVIGFATFFFAYYSWSGKSLYLDDLYVKEKYRGQGIGNRLFETVATLAKENNCVKLKWQVSKWNEKAIGFYKAKGADIDDVEINCDLYF